MDEDLYENPKDFDGLRFYRMRQASGQDNKYKYSSVTKSDLSWGFGRNACPGRYLSAINIKLIMAELLTNYDIKLGDGVSRPQNIEFEVLVSFSHTLLYRKCLTHSSALQSPNLRFF